jgi:predicted AAA+ superfamily ATPase
MTTPWRKIAEPHKDIREERFDPAVFAADLGMVLRDEGPIDYRDPVTFFKKTYPTRGLSNLLLDALRRLSGERRGEAVVQIQTPFGGGKTHVLIALYHLLAHPDQISHLETIQSLLDDAGLDAIPECRVAALIGTALDPSQGRRSEYGLQIRTLWGEMAYQLGGPSLYRKIEASDQNRIAPGTDRLTDLLEGVGPVVLLIDEALEYATKAGGVSVGEGTLLGQTLSFLQELSTVAANRSEMMLVGALPSSYLERFDASAQKAFQQLGRIFGRLEQIRTPVEGAEIYEILRRRLFEHVGEEAERRHVAEAYWDFYQAHASDLPRKVREISYRERIVRAYPFHPELVDILYERWGSLPGFQRTRGVLRLLALVVGDLYKQDSSAGMILPSHVNLDNTRIRREFIKLVDSAYETVIGSDIAGHGAKAPQIDHELGGDYAHDHIAQRLATAIFLYSHTGGTDRGAVAPQLRLSLLHPDMAPALIADAVDRLSDRLWYLYDDPKWYFDKVPNLNRIQTEREDSVGDDDIRDRIRSTVSDLVGHGTFRHTYLWPHESRDIADDRRLGLVVLDPEHIAGTEEAHDFIGGVLKRRGDAFRTFRNALVFVLPDEAQMERARGAARTLLALEGISADYSGSDRLTDRQEEKLADDLSDARSALPQIVYQAYRHIVIPGEGDELERFDVGLQLYKRGESLSKLVWDHLTDRDKLLERLDPHLVRAERWDLWPEKDEPLQLSQLRDYFARYTQMPMLASDAVLLEAVARGIELELFGYGQRAGDEEDYAPLYFGESISSTQLEITDTSWLIPPDMARALTLSTISGRVIDTDGAPLADVTVQLTPGGESIVTGSDGTFAFSQLPSGRYTVKPLRADYTFSPTGRTVTLSGDDVTGLEFMGKKMIGPPETFALSGSVKTEDNEPLSGVRVTAEPGMAESTTDTDGRYAFPSLPKGTYTIQPEKTGYTFDPAEITVALTGHVADRDFVATPEREDVQRVEIRTGLPWERWYDFYSDVLDPLMSVGAEIEIELELTARAEHEIGSSLIERLTDSLSKYDEDAELDAD